MEQIVVILAAKNIFELASEAPLFYRILLIAALAGGAHLIVTIIWRISQLILVGRKKAPDTGGSDFVKRYPRTATIITILESTLTFTIYFVALGLMLQEFNLSLRAYLARLRGEYPDYADWMINITYRSERLIIKDGGLIDEADSDMPTGPALPAASG